MLCTFFIAATLAASAVAQSSVTANGTSSVSNDNVSGGDYVTGTYQSYTSTINLSQISSSLAAISGSSSTLDRQNQTITSGSTVLTTASPTATVLTRSANNSTTGASTTSSSASATNTQACNGYAEFCNRKYSNITQVAAHNSPFDIKGNIASNQALDVTTQLNDGIRMLQFQVHKPNSTSALQLCHTSCDLLNAGTLVDYLTTVREWLDDNPYEVLTILMGNSDVLSPQNFTDPISNSGLERYVYTPPTVPMTLDQWPTLGEMIITQRRVVIMLDYEADQTAIPWLLDEFANFWETPFSPTDRDFPCTENRPPNLDRNTTLNRLMIANHNLNIDVTISSFSLLIPASTVLNETNAVSGYGSLGLMSDNCTAEWGRPPNFLMVDYYNIGNFNGSVFQVAADANGVTYNRNSCCGTTSDSNGAASSLPINKIGVAVVAAVMGYIMMI